MTDKLKDDLQAGLDAHNRRWAQIQKQSEAQDHAARRLAIVIVIIIAVVTFVLPCVFCAWVYGDWKCGLPGIECRKVVK